MTFPVFEWRGCNDPVCKFMRSSGCVYGVNTRGAAVVSEVGGKGEREEGDENKEGE